MRMLRHMYAYVHEWCALRFTSPATVHGTHPTPTLGTCPQSNTPSHLPYRSPSPVSPSPQTNISNLPVRSSASATGGTMAMSQDLSDLQERMKKIQNLGAAVTGAGQPF